jgi:glycosyltransferase involved in cell wall biosynthesis
VKVSVIIPAFNEERLLGQSLDHVNRARGAFAHCGWESELIVCDNNSTDQTARIALTAGATVVFEPVNQIGRARNRGAAAATGDWLLFVDADSQPSAEQAGKCLAGGCTIRLEGNYPLANFVTGVWNWKSRSRRWLAGSFIFCETASFRKLGGFNPEMFVGEELDLTARLHELAQETGREVVILHRHPLLTSARKVRLYSTWEHLRFLFRVATNREATFRNREACYAWYDGRR